MGRVFDRETAYKAVSVLILAILGTQFGLLFIETGRWGWPIITYPMYSAARYDGDRFDDFEVYAVLKDGRKLKVDRGELGMNYWIFQKNVVNPLLVPNGYYQRNTAARRLRAQSEPGSGQGSLSAEDLAILVAKLAPTNDHYCDKSKGAVTRLEVWDSGVAISAVGPIHLEPEVVAAMDLVCE